MIGTEGASQAWLENVGGWTMRGLRWADYIVPTEVKRLCYRSLGEKGVRKERGAGCLRVQ